MIRGRDMNTVSNYCESALDMQIFTYTDKMISKVITFLSSFIASY